MLLNDNHYDSEEQYERDCLERVLRCWGCREAMPEGEAVTVVDEVAGDVEVCRCCANDRRAA